jgi:hypothetical protein
LNPGSYTYIYVEFLNVDIDVARWLGWLFTPVVVIFVLPALILLFLYLSALFLFIYKWHRYIERTLPSKLESLCSVSFHDHF